jgi:hypothetical protein
MYRIVVTGRIRKSDHRCRRQFDFGREALSRDGSHRSLLALRTCDEVSNGAERQRSPAAAGDLTGRRLVQRGLEASPFFVVKHQADAVIYFFFSSVRAALRMFDNA